MEQKWTLVVGWNKRFFFNGPGYRSQIGPYHWIGMGWISGMEWNQRNADGCDTPRRKSKTEPLHTRRKSKTGPLRPAENPKRSRYTPQKIQNGAATPSIKSRRFRV